ncbi:MAG: hypothetical protein M0D55_12845 [Elusimicrobiota bacterium]|nr:MAG: hypothetical protein M0D55_12845 [Elusimicrobiota bacterium]
MRYLGVLLAASLSLPAFAHDEGHGPKTTDAGRMGGVMTAVVLAKEAKLGPKAALIYKAELTRTEDGVVRVYLYDKDMKPLDPARFAKTAKAVLETHKKKKTSKTPFTLALEDGAFKGKAPKAGTKPFNIDAVFKEGDRELLAAFDNLD